MNLFLSAFIGTLLLVTAALGQRPAATPKPTPKPKDTAVVATEGVGIPGVTVGRSTAKDVIKKFGTRYRKETNKKYSYQLTYDRAGISFYYCQSDKKQQIFLIEMKPPFKVRTRRGVTLGTSTREETERIYGKPREGMQYPGIHFYYNRYGKRTVISEIDILEKKGIRQCEVKDDNPRPRTGIVTAPAN